MIYMIYYILCLIYFGLYLIATVWNYEIVISLFKKNSYWEKVKTLTDFEAFVFMSFFPWTARIFLRDSINLNAWLVRFMNIVVIIIPYFIYCYQKRHSQNSNSHNS